MRLTTLPLFLTALTFFLPACGKQSHPEVEDETGPTAPPVEPANPPPPPVPDEIRVPTTQSPGPIPPAIDLTDLPPRFTDYVPQVRWERNRYTGDELVATDPVPFDMVLIPGDAEQGIAAFYLGETEVTWGMVRQWMYATDITSAEEHSRLIQEGLRPSPIYGSIAQELGVQDDDMPALTPTRLTAEAFCIYLSEQTGRRYRLPTPDEFLLALRQGGGFPSDPEALLAVAFLQENALLQEDPFFGPLDPDDPESVNYLKAAPVMSLQPDTTGIYDLLGNAGEWVLEPGDRAYLMGGYFAVPAADLSADWTDVEDHDVWNESYPQFPYSRFWYWGRHNHQGFRLVCEVPE